ncbi:MAG: hypothetical protein CL916_00695 [Deltaproteobacteria bacterium]|nr:hypothetical protein [Deltaproteobacteria bacterium]
MFDRFIKKLEERWSRWDERGYVALISRLNQTQRRHILSKNHGRKVLRVLHRKWKDAHSRNILLGLLLDVDIEQLDLELRVDFIHALQKGRTSFTDEERIVQLICSTEISDLAALKSGLELRGYHNLYDLVYHELSASHRERLLAYFSNHDDQEGKVRVICDIDDTVYANWKDEKFPKKTVYPGVLAFISCLVQNPQDLVFLTARPKDRGHLSERLTRRRLQGFGFTDPVVLVGRWHQVHSDEVILERKWTNVQRYHHLYPYDRFIFLGDSGQLDAVLVQRMKRAGLLMWAGIHEIEPKRAPAWKQRFPEANFFHSYAQAAFFAWKQGLMTKEQFEFVCIESHKELSLMPQCPPKRWEEWNEIQKIWKREESS